MKGVFDSLFAEFKQKTVSQENGEKFEDFIMIHFSRSKEFKISSPKRYVHGAVSEDIQKPDFVIEHLPSKKKFYVECKWRSKWEGSKGSEKISLDEFKPQLLRHKAMQDESKIRAFLALGIGKLVSIEKGFIPMELYFVPLSMIYDNFKELRREYLIKYSRGHFVFPPFPVFDPKMVDLQ